MSRMTFAILKQKADNINRTMPEGYRLKMTQCNGYTAIDLYNDEGMLSNLMCGTPKECGLALDLAYKLRISFKMN